MTTITAFHDPDVGTWIAADQQTSGNDLRLPAATCKLIRFGQYVVGVTGEHRTINVLEEEGFESSFDGIADAMDRIRIILDQAEYKASNDHGAPHMAGHYLLAGPDGVWDVDGSLSYTRINDNTLWAAGSGSELAIGAGHVLTALGVDPSQIVVTAIQTAATYDVWTGSTVTTRFIPALPKTT
jgi:ATP-dependent protease HslVU (ClpYQ) peptidase subunit